MREEEVGLDRCFPARPRAWLTPRCVQIHELQKALSDSNVYLYDEREQVLKLQAENDQLKIQELEDRRRIQVRTALAAHDVLPGCWV